MDKRTQRGGGIASPPFLFVNAGPCIVAGNAACLHDDLERAWNIYPDAPLIAVNGAAREVKALALYSKHPDRFVTRRWVHHQQRKFGDDFTVHGSNVAKNGPIPVVDYWWQDCIGLGGSAWGARKLATLMGFDEVILCGCPLDAGPYVGNHNLGGLMADESVVQDLRDGIEAETEWHEGVTSMSGWTKEFLGEPNSI